MINTKLLLIVGVVVLAGTAMGPAVYANDASAGVMLIPYVSGTAASPAVLQVKAGVGAGLSFGTPYGYGPYGYGYGGSRYGGYVGEYGREYGGGPGYFQEGRQICVWNGYNYKCYNPR